MEYPFHYVFFIPVFDSSYPLVVQDCAHSYAFTLSHHAMPSLVINFPFLRVPSLPVAEVFLRLLTYTSDQQRWSFRSLLDQHSAPIYAVQVLDSQIIGVASRMSVQIYHNIASSSLHLRKLITASCDLLVCNSLSKSDEHTEVLNP